MHYYYSVYRIKSLLPADVIDMLDSQGLPPACSRPQSRNTEGGAYRPPYSAVWETKGEWLPWSSGGCEHGIKAHRVSKAGYIEEVGDRAATPRKRIKSVSSRQWEKRS